jgi:hypothetical protein
VHGLIFGSLRDFSIERLGPEAASEIWADRIFEMNEAYDDAWFAAQLERVIGVTGESPADVEREFGAFAARKTFAALYPSYYEASGDVFTFLLGIEEKIHELVRATIPGATPPRLHVHSLKDLGVLIAYTSERGLCKLLEGLVLGTAAHYGDDVEVEEIQCMHRGEPGCVFTVLRT